jgi:hypothetical protein
MEYEKITRMLAKLEAIGIQPAAFQDELREALDEQQRRYRASGQRTDNKDRAELVMGMIFRTVTEHV